MTKKLILTAVLMLGIGVMVGSASAASTLKRKLVHLDAVSTKRAELTAIISTHESVTECLTAAEGYMREYIIPYVQIKERVAKEQGWGYSYATGDLVVTETNLTDSGRRESTNVISFVCEN